MKVSEALKRQGSVQHWWLEAFGRTACRSWVGSCTRDRDNVTCEDCLAGRTAEDTVTDTYGQRREARKGQLGL